MTGGGAGPFKDPPGSSIRYVVPFRSDGGVRDRLWAFCQQWWHGQGIYPIRCLSPEGPFNRAAAINAGAEGDWDVLVVLDADVVCPGAQVYQAAENALGGLLWLGFTEYVGLSPGGTEDTLTRGRVVPQKLRRAFHHESSVVAIGRGLWDEVGGFDDRFVGWGGEDSAFAQACRVLAGIGRVEGKVFHLFHPVAREKNRRDPLWQANQRLARRYRETTTPEAMRELVGERWDEPRHSLTSTAPTHGTA